MKAYNAPELEVLKYDVEDIVTTSGGADENFGGGGQED